jgi:hypothetical protein
MSTFTWDTSACTDSYLNKNDVTFYGSSTEVKLNRWENNTWDTGVFNWPLPTECVVTAGTITLYNTRNWDVPNNMPSIMNNVFDGWWHVLKKAFTESQVNWYQAKTGISWSGLGATTAADFDMDYNASTGVVSLGAAPMYHTSVLSSGCLAAINTYIANTQVFPGFILNNFNSADGGFHLIGQYGVDGYVASHQHATPAFWPRLTLDCTTTKYTSGSYFPLLNKVQI